MYRMPLLSSVEERVSPMKMETRGANCMLRQSDDMKPHRYILRPAAERREQWDQFVSEHPGGHLLQSWGWGELKASVGWHPLRLALWDTEQQRIVAAAQVLRRTTAHIPLQFGYLAYIPKGPVMNCSQQAGANIIHAFFSQLHLYLHQQAALALQVELAYEVDRQESNKIAQYMDAMRFQPVQAIQPSRTILLDLAPG